MAGIKNTYLKCKTDGKIRYADGKYYKFIFVKLHDMPVKIAFECKKDGSLTEKSLDSLKELRDEGKLY